MEAVVEVHGFNGDSVTLAGPDTGIDGMWLATELEGLMDPESEAITASPGNRPGSRFVSNRIIERTIIFKVTIENDEAGGWHQRDARWRKLWSYSEYSTIEVTVNGESRTLQVRLSEIEVDTTYDPGVNEATDVTMTVVADDPFWHAPDLIITASTFDAEKKTANYTIPVPNPTSNRVYPVWVLSGGAQWQIPDVQVSRKGVTNRAIKLPMLMLPEDAVLNCDPGARQLMSVTGSPVWNRMNGVRMKSRFDAYSTKPLELTVTAVAQQTGFEFNQSTLPVLRIPRVYSRPWGDV